LYALIIPAALAASFAQQAAGAWMVQWQLEHQGNELHVQSMHTGKDMSTSS
jgi:hypothetical protein